LRPVHTTSANPPLLQSSLRKEPEVALPVYMSVGAWC
jgi:hypothetical protein